MLVVADSSPINVLVRLDCVHVLSRLFEVVLVPPEVAEELSRPSTPEVVRRMMLHRPEWLQVRAPRRHTDIPHLDPGERSAISLFLDSGADALLIDDLDGRREAVRRRIFIIGTLGVLERAAERDLVDLRSVADRLMRSTDFRIDPRLIEAALARDDQCRRRTPLP